MKLTLEIETTDNGLIGSENEKLFTRINKILKPIKAKRKIKVSNNGFSIGSGCETITEKKFIKSFGWKLEN